MITKYQNNKGLGCFYTAFALVFFGLLAAGHSQTSYDFNLAASTPIQSLVVEPDGKILAGYWFSTFRLEANGTLDPSFNVNCSGPVCSVAAQNDGNVLLGGQFTSINGQERKSLARLLANGSLDLDFNPRATRHLQEAAGDVWALTFQDDDKILVRGRFDKLGGHATTNLGRLNPDGTPDTAFAPAVGWGGGYAYELAVQADGKILLGGGLWPFGGGMQLARLNPNGTQDTSFQPTSVSQVHCMVVQPDGKVLLGGRFSLPQEQTNNWIGRLNADGSLDATFQGRADAEVCSLALQSDGKILVGGFFTNLNGTVRQGLGRLNQDGTLDESFVPPAYWGVWALGLQRDGKILIGAGLDTNTFMLGRLQNTGPATESLSSDGYSIRWLRGGTSPEVSSATFHYSINGTDWLRLGPGTRISGGWEIQGVSIPPNASIRARGRVAVTQYDNPSWLIETTAQMSQPLPSIIRNDSRFGFSANQFGFSYAGSNGLTVVVEACTDLNAPAWVPMLTNTITQGTSYFSDPQWTNYPARFYRLRAP